MSKDKGGVLKFVQAKELKSVSDEERILEIKSIASRIRNRDLREVFMDGYKEALRRRFRNIDDY